MEKRTTSRIGAISGRDLFDAALGGAGSIALIATALSAFFPDAAEAVGTRVATRDTASVTRTASSSFRMPDLAASPLVSVRRRS